MGDTELIHVDPIIFFYATVLYIVEFFITSPGQWNVNDEESTEGKLFHTGKLKLKGTWFGGKVLKIHMYMKSNILTVECKY